MRIEQLSLHAFGPFTDVVLDLSGGHEGLHIVHGPNEAGKSSALRALRQLLYGIPARSTDNFQHPHPDLRIGATLRDSNGVTLSCVRRKGTRNTLRAADDDAIVNQSELLALMGGLDEESFSRRFGIDHHELVKGGRAIAEGGGDFSKMLFAAGAGIADLGAVQRSLADDAGRLFKPSGRNPEINSRLAKLKEKRDEIKQFGLPSTEWKKHDTALAEAERRKHDIDVELLQKRSVKTRWERMSEALPLITQRTQLGGELREVADAPLLDQNFPVHRIEAATQLGNARDADLAATNAIDAVQTAIAELDVAESLIQHKSAITQLHTDLGGYRKAAKDRPELLAKLQQAEAAARAILSELGHEPQLERTEHLRLSRTQRQRIQSLGNHCSAILNQNESAHELVRKMESEIKRSESRLTEMPSPVDTTELQRSLRRAQEQGDLDDRLAKARLELRQLNEQVAIDFERLPLWSGRLDDVETLAVPSFETIELFERRFSDAESELNSLTDRRDQTGEQLRRIELSLENLRLAQDVPAEDDLQTARDRRDAGWQLIRQSWREDATNDDAIAEYLQDFDSVADLADAFRVSVEAADVVADRLRREADRVAEKAKLTADQQQLQTRLEDSDRELKAARAKCESSQDEWRQSWSSLQIEPLSPREMQSWANQHLALLNSAQTLRKLLAVVDDLEQLTAMHRDELLRCVSKLNETPTTSSDSLVRLRQWCEDVVKRFEAANREREKLDDERRNLQNQQAEAAQAAEQAKQDLAEWRREWAAAVDRLGLNDNAAPAEANTVLSAIDELFTKLADADDKRERVGGIDQEAKRFSQDVQRLVDAVAVDLRQLSADQAIADLYDRLERALTEQARLDELNEQLKRETPNQSNAQSQVEKLDAAIANMCREAGCESLEDLPAAEQRSARRRLLEYELQQVESRLTEFAAGATLEDFVTEALQLNSDELQPMIRQLNEDIVQLESEKSLVSETIGSERTELNRMDGSARAAEAEEDAQELLAEIRSHAEQYVRLRLAAAVLRDAIERYREKNQGPVLTRASELFEQLTLGHFARLRADYDDKGEAVLVGVRPDGKRIVDVAGMSDGTCDQLYLALRLASLEVFVLEREPIPFIVDDIMIRFDDDRSIAALRALARFSEHTQVILFTHHDHLVELAKDNLEADVLFKHALDSRQHPQLSSVYSA